MDLGGQVLKYPAEDPEPATDAVIVVVPGCAAVITLVALFRVATEAVPTEYVSAPIELEQLGTEVTPGGNPPGQEYCVTVGGAQNSYCVPPEVKQASE
jgi:hypothetical protein